MLALCGVELPTQVVSFLAQSLARPQLVVVTLDRDGAIFGRHSGGVDTPLDESEFPEIDGLEGGEALLQTGRHGGSEGGAVDGAEGGANGRGGRGHWRAARVLLVLNGKENVSMTADSGRACPRLGFGAGRSLAERWGGGMRAGC